MGHKDFDVPIGVIIEWKRKLQEQREANRPRLEIPIPTYEPLPDEKNKEDDNDETIIISMI